MRNRIMIERLTHLRNILEMLKGKENLYYGEYAAITNVSMSYASNLFRMIAYRFNFPHKYGVIDNPSDEKVSDAIQQIEEDINKLSKQVREKKPKLKKAPKKAHKKR